MDETREPGIRVAQVYMSHAQFAHSEHSHALPADTAIPAGNLAINFRSGVTPDALKGFVAVRVESASGDSALYQFSVEYMAFFEADPDRPNLDLRTFVQLNGAAFLFPFLREAVANLTQRGRFGPVWIQPTNLSRLDAQHVPGNDETTEKLSPE